MTKMNTLQTACAIGILALSGCAVSNHADHSMPNSTHAGVTLQSHHWQLKQAYTAQGQMDQQWILPSSLEPNNTATAIGLRFWEDNNLSIDRLCNNMRGSYRTEGNAITISPIAATLMACNNQALDRLERNVAQQLPKAQTWQITGDRTHPSLELTFDGGARWQLQGTATKETQYGKGEQIFLEVAPQTVPCSTAASGAQCLQVRSVHYNEKGIKTGVGSWSTHHGAIEGYTHQAGERSVLRIKRYTRSQTPHDYVDVLDLRVESEIVR